MSMSPAYAIYIQKFQIPQAGIPGEPAQRMPVPVHWHEPVVIIHLRKDIRIQPAAIAGAHTPILPHLGLDALYTQWHVSFVLQPQRKALYYRRVVHLDGAFWAVIQLI